MSSRPLSGCRLLIVEDEYYLADDARSALTEVGAEILGPVATVDQASALVDTERQIDAVVLDVNLRGELAFDLADTLRGREIPFVFLTGYDRGAIPRRHADAPRLDKPVDTDRLIRLLGSVIHSQLKQPAG